KQSAAGDKTTAAGAGETGEATSAAATAGDSEKPDPIQPGQDSGALHVVAKPQSAMPARRTEAAAAAPGTPEKSNPIPPCQDNGALKAATQS
ncbi:MAG: hypothetical protein C0504_04915, partial [Candidatus Solibacter sp.]|nr:hypothetical protein [Candidatus Solibacter sp.]